jgi:hypothetical protein
MQLYGCGEHIHGRIDLLQAWASPAGRSSRKHVAWHADLHEDVEHAAREDGVRRKLSSVQECSMRLISF